jgi:hypothetical protein
MMTTLRSSGIVVPAPAPDTISSSPSFCGG